jgi:hypothetical protein
LKTVGGFGAVSLLGSMLAVAACSSDDSGGGDQPAPTGGVTGSGGSAPTGGTPSSTGGKAPTTGGMNSAGQAGGTATGGGPAIPANAYDVSVVVDNIKFIGMGTTPAGGAGAGGMPAGGGGSGGAATAGGGAGGTLAGGNGGGGAPPGGGAGKSAMSVIPPQFQQVGGAGAGGVGGAGGAGGSGGAGAPAAGSGGTLGGGGGGGADAGGMPAGGMPAGGSGGGSGICTPVKVTDPLITDFDTNWTTDQFKASSGYTGGLFAYPPDGPTPIAFKVADGAATFSGKVGIYSGFGVWLSCEVDASSFQGVEFDIKGNPGASGQVKFLVQTSPNVYDAMPGKDHDTCMPANTAEPWASCVNPSKMISVTSEVTHVTVMWADLGMGKPEMGVDQKQVLGLQWDFTWPPMAAGGSTGTGGTPAATGGTPAATGGMPAGGGGSGGTAGGAGGAGGSGGAGAPGGSGGGGAGGTAAGSGGRGS